MYDDTESVESGVCGTPLEVLQSGYQQRRKALGVKRELDEVNLRKSYHKALESLMGAAQERREFSNFVKIENEVKRTKNTLQPAKENSKIEGLANLQGILEEQFKTLDREEACSLVNLRGKRDQTLV